MYSLASHNTKGKIGTSILFYISLLSTHSGNDINDYCDYLLSFRDDATAIANLVYWAWGVPSCIDATYASTVEYYLWGVENFDAGKSQKGEKPKTSIAMDIPDRSSLVLPDLQ